MSLHSTNLSNVLYEIIQSVLLQKKKPMVALESSNKLSKFESHKIIL